MSNLLKFLSHGLVAGLMATVIGLYIEYNVFQTPNGTQIIYEGESASTSLSGQATDSEENSINFFKVSESESFLLQPEGILKITKSHKPLFQAKYNTVYSKTHIGSISGFEIFYSPIIFTKQLKIVTSTSNGKFFDVFDVDGAFSEAAFGSFVDNVLKKKNPNISIVKKERNTQTHIAIVSIAFVLFLIFRINRAINNFTDTIFKGIESVFK